MPRLTLLPDLRRGNLDVRGDSATTSAGTVAGMPAIILRRHPTRRGNFGDFTPSRLYCASGVRHQSRYSRIGSMLVVVL